MLPSQHRIHRRRDFELAVREGRRASTSLLVGYLATRAEANQPTQVGFIVSRSVGGAVIRNQVRRRLRDIVRGRMEQLPAGALFVIRVLPAAAQAESRVLAAELDGVLSRLTPGTR